ncbi:MAG: CRISPR-associated ring nuclease [Candidatus Aenigmatarchaeota archaeon]
MEKVALISILGESSGVVTEALEFLNNKNIKEVENIVIHTKERRILEEVKVLKKALSKFLKDRFKIKINSKFWALPINDITNEKDIEKLEKFLEKIKKKIRNKKKIIFNISGGRKLMIILTLKYLEKNFRRVNWINIISFVPTEKIVEVGERIREKINIGIKPEKEEIEEYFFSKGNYKVFEFGK